MRPCTPALQALLDSWDPLARIQVADLYTLTLMGGETIRFTAFQVALSAPAPNTTAPLFLFPPVSCSRAKTSVKIGTQVSEFELDLLVSSGDMLGLTGGNLSWQLAVWAGIFDGADVAVDRAYISSAGVVVGTINWFTGRVGDIENGRTKITMRIKSLLDLLTQQMPRRLFQAACGFVFGDANCLFDRTTMAATVAATTADQNQVVTGLVPSPSTLYDNGTIVGVSGANAGYKRSVGKMAGGTAYFLKPWIFPVAIGDQFQLLPGCDHTVATCDGTFNNIIHYGGFPYIPPPETAVLFLLSLGLGAIYSSLFQLFA